MCKRIREDIAAVRQRDPAARSGFEILLMYAGVHALFWHRPAHWLYRHHCFFLARLVSQLTRFFTGIEIHPGAVIGHNVFIDHGSGIVIGETAEVGDGCTLYQGVTRVVRVSNVKLENERLDHVHIPDPIQQELNRAHRQIAALEQRLTVLEAELEKERGK